MTDESWIDSRFWTGTVGQCRVPESAWLGLEPFEAQGPPWHVAMRPGKRRLLNPFIESEFVAERVEKMKASARAKVEHPFRVIKQQVGFTKVRYRGFAKNTAQIVTLLALSNPWPARRHLIGIEG